MSKEERIILNFNGWQKEVIGNGLDFYETIECNLPVFPSIENKDPRDTAIKTAVFKRRSPNVRIFDLFTSLTPV